MGRASELRELTRVRVLGMLREPEAVFWVFVFPLVLAAVLGFAFRSGKVEPSRVAVAPAAEATALVAALEAGDDMEVLAYDEREEALGQLRTAAVDALVSPADEPGGAPAIRFDSARAEAETARLRI